MAANKLFQACLQSNAVDMIVIVIKIDATRREKTTKNYMFVWAVIDVGKNSYNRCKRKMTSNPIVN